MMESAKPKKEGVGERLDRRLVAVMFTDMVGYTALMQADKRIGIDRRDRYWAALERHHEVFGGTIVQRLGDGRMSMFASSLDAVLAGVAIQGELAAQEVPVRIGIHVGEVIVEPEQLTGDAVNIAARIESFAVPGGVMLSDTAYEQIRNRSDIGVVGL
jgi:class 3 adenylate cyclase